jgi:hypothetical protein
MAATATQFPPRLHNDVYPFIYPSKFKGSLQDKVAIITGKHEMNSFVSVQHH